MIPVCTHIIALFIDPRWVIEYSYNEPRPPVSGARYTDGVPRFRPGDDITFRTFSTLKVSAHVRWRENLRCLIDGEWNHFDYQVDDHNFPKGHKNIGLDNRRGGYTWREPPPKRLAICEIEGTVDLLLPFWAVAKAKHAHTTKLFVVNWVDECGTSYLDCIYDD